jgi:CHRD domain
MLRYPIKLSLTVALATLMAGPALAQEYKAQLNGFFELGALNAETGAILTNGIGKLTLDVDPNGQTASYSLTYSGLTSAVLQAHLHFAKVHVPGGIYAFLCTNLGNGPAGTPACPNPSGTVTGTITPASILAVPGQNIAAGDFTALLQALSSNTTYVNVHTNNFKSGEIRGQVQLANDDEDERRGQSR